MANEFIKEKFGFAPRGLWLTERIWEPHLPKVLARTGIDYVMVDDHHFLSAGIAPEKLLGYYVTEEEGRSRGLPDQQSAPLPDPVQTAGRDDQISAHAGDAGREQCRHPGR